LIKKLKNKRREEKKENKEKEKEIIQIKQRNLEDSII
jgi:hypothetical protein